MTVNENILPRYTRLEKWAFGLFWSWNLIFVAFLLLGFAPQVLPELIRSVRDGTIPIPFLIYGIVLVSIPLIAIAIGATILRHEPRRLFALGYAVEGPLMLLLLIRFFVIRDDTLAVNLLIMTGLIGIGGFFWNLLDRRPQSRPMVVRYLKVIGLTLFLMLAIYASIWVLFYAIPLLAVVGRAIYTFLLDVFYYLGNFWRGLKDLFQFGNMILLNILGGILLLYTATLFVLMPAIVPVLAVRAWLNGFRSLTGLSDRRVAYGLSAAAFVTVMALMLLFTQQPQHRAFALLAEPPGSESEAQLLMRQQETIRQGLLNAYLAPVRYLTSVGEVGHISDFYTGALKLPDEQAKQVQGAYEWVVRPLLYEPVDPVDFSMQWENRPLQQEPLKAAQLYESFFDEPIHVAERDTVVRAVRSTWDGNRAMAAWQAIDDREIHLVTQEVNITEQGDWAEVELYEVYQNQTSMQQEVIYYFSLPESAVLTGVWLNDRPERGSRYKYQVAPRGAAQAIYRNEKVIMRDPALLEQIGPRQYRLRIFPIEPRRWIPSGNRGEGSFVDTPMYMWMTYRVLQQNGEWPMPHLAEVRNVYWDADTQRLLAGEPFSGDDWLAASIPASNPVAAAQHQFTFASEGTVLAIPLVDMDIPELPTDIRLAVVLDRSRSMLQYAEDVQTTLAELQEHESRGAAIDVYLTSSIYRGEPAYVSGLQSVLSEEIVFFGGQNASELLAQYHGLSQDKQYDAILILTDGSGYELGATAVENEVPEAPLWLVHLNGDFPLGYDDGTLEAIQASGGGVAGSLDEAFTRIGVSMGENEPLLVGAGVPAGSNHVDIMDGYAWVSFPAGTEGLVAFTSTSSEDFGAFAARQVILSEMQRNRGKLDDLSVLDALHTIAVEHHVVTPYSSMIVLVNAQQRRNLETLEGQEDRFDREFEGSGDTVPQVFSVTGVPEPEEWLLMGLAAGLLAWYYRKSLRQRLHFGSQSGMHPG